MSEKTAGWIWQSLEAARSVTVVAQAHLAQIRRMVVYWNSAESGAAGLADADFLELDGPLEPAFKAALEIFMTTAELPSFDGKVLNPYARARKNDRALLEDTPDAEVVALLLSGHDFDLKAAPEEVALWSAANRRASGIDPKRPFGSESVSRDVRAIIDPHKKLSNAAFSRRRKHLESRLLLLLQFFVQNGRLEPGVYRRGSDWVWRRMEDSDAPPVETLTRQEWAGRMFGQMHYQCQEYAETLHCLIHLVWDNRLTGSYAVLARQFKLENHFDSQRRAEYEGGVEERLRTALVHFPERNGETASPWFTLTLARILNAQARFAEAGDVLKQADLYELAPDEVDLSTINAIGIAFLEGLITRRGLDLLDEEQFQSILAGCHSDWRTRSTLWDFVWNVRREPDRCGEGPGSPGTAHAQALAAQVELMRGGYDPDNKVTHF